MSLSLWKRIQQNDLQAFDEFYHQYVSGLYSYGKSLVNDESLVDDAIQMLFVNLYQKRQSLTIRTSPKSYLYTSLRRQVIDLNKERRKTEDLDFTTELELQDKSYEQKLIESDSQAGQIEKLFEAKRSLTKRQKEIIHLKFTEELDYNEISEVMKISKDAAYKLVNQAIKRLSENF